MITLSIRHAYTAQIPYPYVHNRIQKGTDRYPTGGGLSEEQPTQCVSLVIVGAAYLQKTSDAEESTISFKVVTKERSIWQKRSI